MRAIWPVQATERDTGNVWLKGFDVDAGDLGTLRLRLGRGSNKTGRGQSLEAAVRGALGGSIGSVWRDIPELDPAILGEMRHALSENPRRLVLWNVGLVLPLFAALTTIVGYAGLGGYEPRPLSEARAFFLAMAIAVAVWFVLYFAVIAFAWRRGIRHSDAINMYAQVRRHEQNAGTRILPAMQVSDYYRGVDPTPPPVDTSQADHVMRLLERDTAICVAGVAVGLGLPVVWAYLSSTFSLPPIASIWIFAFPFILMFYSIDRYLRADEKVRRLRRVVHEEWKTDRRYFSGGRLLRLWGIHRDPVALVQKYLSRPDARKWHPMRGEVLFLAVVLACVLMFLASITVLSGGAARVAFIASAISLVIAFIYIAFQRTFSGPDVAVRAAIDYERVTGRSILPPDFDASAGLKAGGWKKRE